MARSWGRLPVGRRRFPVRLVGPSGPSRAALCGVVVLGVKLCGVAMVGLPS